MIDRGIATSAYQPAARNGTADATIDGVLTAKQGLATPGVPEPATWAMLILGLGAVGVCLRRRRASA